MRYPEPPNNASRLPFRVPSWMIGVFLDDAEARSMNAAAPAIDRDAKGRFRAGCSGNPAGKKTGTRNRATLLKEARRLALVAHQKPISAISPRRC